MRRRRINRNILYTVNSTRCYVRRAHYSLAIRSKSVI